jgi:hypothetical protein
MAKGLNTGLYINAPEPVDGRLKVSTYAGLALIPIVYIGLKTYVVDEDKEYRYYSSGWAIWNPGVGGGSSVWGSITGSIANQSDLILELGYKYDKTGGYVAGSVEVRDAVTASNVILTGSSASSIDMVLTAPNNDMYKLTITNAGVIVPVLIT